MKKEIQPRVILETNEKNLKIGIIVLSSEQAIDYINQPAEDLFLLLPRDRRPKTLDDILRGSPDLLQWIRAFLEDESREAGEINFVEPTTRKEHELRISKYRMDSGVVKNSILQFKDISQKRQAVFNLETTQKSVAALLDTLNDYYFEIDIRGVVTNINQAFCQQLGYKLKEDIIGKHLRHFTDRDSVRLVYQNYQKVFENRETVNLFRYTYHTRYGKEFIGETTVTPIIEGDRVIGARGLLRDVTERVQAEENLQKATDNLVARVNELKVINRISMLMSESLDLNKVLHSLCEEFTNIFPVRNAGIGIITPDKESLEVVAFHSEILEEETLEGTILPLEGVLAFEEVIKDKKPLWIMDAGTDPRLGSVAELAAERGTRSLLIAPLLSRGTAIGTIWMPGKDPAHVFTEKEMELAGTIAGQIATAIDNAQLFARTEKALDTVQHDLEIGKAIQSGFFPETIPTIPGWEISTYYEPARYVSGDFFDIFQLEGSKKTAFVIADVCDKGVGAALFMVLFRSLIRAFSRNVKASADTCQSLLEMVRNTNAYVSGIHGNANMFATMFVGIIDPDEGSIHYINGGHEPPVVLDKQGVVRCRLEPTGPAVGLFENAQYETRKILLEPGDFLVGYTDGTLDAEDSKGNAYSEERFLRYIQAPWTSLFSMVYEVKNEIRKHAGEQKQFDDITLLSIRRKANPLQEKHGICREAYTCSPVELMDFVEAAAIESKMTPEEAASLRFAIEVMCEYLFNSGQYDNKPGLFSLFFEKEDERVSITIRDDGAPLGEEWKKSLDAELEGISSSQESREPGMHFDALTYEVMEQGGNKISLHMTRIARDY